ncbi:MAG: ATP-dependent DNA helicase [Armatimonadota bacterium]|nr:ATP-dependent DNA helicase [Armatimonadota bacterium]MDR5696910.1 ATP-dependent DNA helicase [Armatimonadota bacterium]
MGGGLAVRVEGIFGSALPTRLAGYEPRPAQVEMAGRVARAIERRQHLIAEAGTGTGKSLAYLVPAALHALQEGEVAVVSTATHNLQEQLMRKDLPVVRDLLGGDLVFAAIKGLANYLCVWRLDREIERFGFARDEFVDAIARWAQTTQTGDRSELPFVARGWHQVNADPDHCIGLDRCRVPRCFMIEARRAAASAHVVVANHHLVLADLLLKDTMGPNGGILPAYSVMVFDEAHMLEEAATQVFGLEIGHVRVQRIAAEAARRGWVSARITDALLSASQAFFAQVGTHRPAVLPSLPQAAADALVAALKAVRDALEDVVGDDEATSEEVRKLAGRTERVVRELRQIREGSGDAYVVWVAPDERNPALRASLVWVGDRFASLLASHVPTAVFTSATLAVAGTLAHFASRIGLGPDEFDTLVAPSPFAFGEQAALYVPPHLPDPSSEDFLPAAVDEIERVLRFVGGRTLVLFTSYRNLDSAYLALSGRVPYPLLRQGDAPRDRLLREFAERTDSVLLGTESFWQGVDVPGESLSCVVIDRLPFDVPDDPVTQARMQAVVREGGDAFWDFQLPQAVLRLRQGVGRLIRHSTDRGLVVILDGRILRRRYGSVFLASLPPMRRIKKLEEADRVSACPGRDEDAM